MSDHVRECIDCGKEISYGTFCSKCRWENTDWHPLVDEDPIDHEDHGEEEEA